MYLKTHVYGMNNYLSSRIYEKNIFSTTDVHCHAGACKGSAESHRHYRPEYRQILDKRMVRCLPVMFAIPGNAPRLKRLHSAVGSLGTCKRSNELFQHQ